MQCQNVSQSEKSIRINYRVEEINDDYVNLDNEYIHGPR